MQGNQGNISRTQPDELPAIPLWIGGHAYLTVTDAFASVRRASDNAPLRRLPVCREREVEAAIRSACEALPIWSALSMPQRFRRLNSVGAALSDYADHFASLIQEETGISLSEAAAEVATAADHLRYAGDMANNPAQTGSTVVAQASPRTIAIGCSTRRHPLSGFLRLAVPAWRAGHVIIARTSNEAPSALFALAELTARCHWPAGAFCLLYGDATTDNLLQAAGCRVARD